MKTLRAVLLAALVVPAMPAAATEDAAFSHALSLVQMLIRIGAHSEDPQKAFDDVLAGRNTEANRALAGLMEEVTADMPKEHKDKVASIGRDLAVLAKKPARPGAAPLSGQPSPSIEAAIQARKDLHGMGLTYYDEKQYLDAVKRGDRVAIDLFIAAQGLPSARR